jgi:hypothetical protein
MQLAQIGDLVKDLLKLILGVFELLLVPALLIRGTVLAFQAIKR